MRTKVLMLLLTALFALSFSTLYAQTESKKHEIGLQFSGLNADNLLSFNALYRKQKSENVYRRIRATFGNLNLYSRNEQATLGFNAGLAIGREKRKTLDRKLEFYRGPEISAGLSFVTGDVNDGRVEFSAGFGYVLGLQHSFTELWAINLETIPRIGAQLSVGDVAENDDFSIGANFSSAVSLGIIRKF